MSVQRNQTTAPGEVHPLRDAFRQFFRLLHLIRPYWPPLARGMWLGVVLGLLGMVSPYLGKLLIDEVYASRDAGLMHLLVAGILTVSVASSLLGAVRSYYTLYTTTHLGNATSLLFFNHLQHLPARFFEQHRVGEIMSRFQDVRSSLNSVSRVFETLFLNGAYLLLVPPFLFLLEWRLALVALVTTPLTVVVTAISGRLLRKYWKRSAEAHADLNAFQVEVLSHIRTLKAMGLESEVYRRASTQVRDAVRVQLRAGGYAQGFGTVNGVIRALGTALLTWYAWTLILARQMTLGDYVAFMAYLTYLQNPLVQITSLFSEFQQSAVSLGRMFEYLDRPAEQDPAGAYLPAPEIRHVVRGELRMREVAFGYTPGNPVLQDVALDFPAGSVTAVVGPSGAGKSSLLRLLTRLEEPESGEVLVDGVPVTGISLPDLRRQVTVVWQEASLLRGTVWENLTLGAPEATRTEVAEAVRLCRLEELVAGLPEGYDTPIAEWGASLSGGQRQRLALARALIRDTPVLLLDEATSNVDVQTENEILRDLFSRGGERTVVFVTHRVQTAALADRVCLIEGGRVAAVGTHAELLHESELYRRMNGVVPEAPRLRVLGQSH